MEKQFKIINNSFEEWRKTRTGRRHLYNRCSYLNKIMRISVILLLHILLSACNNVIMIKLLLMVFTKKIILQIMILKNKLFIMNF